MISDIIELKKGDTIIVKDYARFELMGFTKINGDVFSIEEDTKNITIKCMETDTFESINIESGKIFLMN